MRQRVAWLYSELPGLVERGVLSAEAAGALRRHYGPSGPADTRSGWGQVLLASFGALLVGGGLILILAHNWDGLSRPGRAAIALVGQTYHVGGSFEGLMVTWLYLVVLIPYVTGSALAGIGFWALLVLRAANAGWRDTPLDPWVLALIAFPYVVLRVRRRPRSWGTALVTIAATVSVLVARIAWSIVRYESALRSGVRYQIRAVALDPADAFRGRYVPCNRQSG